MQITIKNETIQLKNSMRAIMCYEQITGKPFSPVTMTEMVIYFYSTIIASNLDLELTFDEFVQWVDDNGDMLPEFIQWITNQNKMNEPLKQPVKESKKKKKQ